MILPSPENHPPGALRAGEGDASSLVLERQDPLRQHKGVFVSLLKESSLPARVREGVEKTSMKD